MVLASLDESLARSGLDYFDLYLVHFPQAMQRDGLLLLIPRVCRSLTPHAEHNKGKEAGDGHPAINDAWTFNQTWADMEKALASGKVRAIGVSNFSVKTCARA
jgi:glycerol 2-dehydrogenase (NADP+)